MCKVSVVLPVYNVAAHIEETLNSLLNQTFQSFEILVFDDCSTDNTVDVVRRFTDPRIHVIVNEHNLGRAGTDNSAIRYVKGEYIAKMDGDDICHPERLAKQVAILEQRPEINVVGSWMQNFGDSDYLNRYPEHPADAQALTLFTLPTGNPSVMMRASLFQEQGMYYNAQLRQTEDFDFFARYLPQLRIYTVQAPLIQYRVPPNRHKKNILTERASVADTVRAELLTAWGIAYTEQELVLHNALAMLAAPMGFDVTLGAVDAWLQKLLAHNTNTLWFDTAALARCLGQRWFEACYTFAPARLQGAIQFYRSPLSKTWQPTAKQHLKLWIRSLQKM
jgi:glycosyltransferase involved in cell wall biosynthesis